ncbi:MAG: 50S ribosomal protein L3 [bacterium]
MKYIIGRKIEMSQLFEENGKVVPVTVIDVSTNIVTGLKTIEKNGYSAVQLATEEQKESRVAKAQLGAFGGKGYKVVKEFRTETDPTVEVGAEISADTFEKGDKVIVTGTSKAKGFQGVVKRHGFHGGPRSHGQKHSEREPGSIGGGPGRAGGRVVKGMRMAGRTGGDTVTVSGLVIARVDQANGKIYVRGAVPGRRGSVVQIVG